MVLWVPCCGYHVLSMPCGAGEACICVSGRPGVGNEWSALPHEEAGWQERSTEVSKSTT